MVALRRRYKFLMRKAWIYKIISPSGRIYIGSTINLKKRMSDYSNITAKQQVRIYRSIQKYGWDAHKYEVILITTEDKMLEAERLLGEYYNVLKKGLNLRLPKVGDMPCFSDETRNKIRLANLGKKHSDETRAKLRAKRNLRICKPCSEETKRKISESNKGKIISRESVEKMRIAKIGKKPSAETRAKLSAARKGRIVSEHTRKLYSIIHKGKIVSEETRQKQSAVRKGRKLPPDRLAKFLAAANAARKPENILAAQEARKKLILNIQTGIYYPSIVEASNSVTHIKRTTLNAMLTGQCKNKSPFIYA